MSTRSEFATEPIPLPAGIKDVHILLADSDEPPVAHLHQQLEAGGYLVHLATTADEVMQAVYNENLHLVLLGTHLHDALAIDLCRRLKSDSDLGFLPIVVMAEPGSEWDDELADAVLFKPITPRELHHWLRFLLRAKLRFEHLLHENQKLTEAAREMAVLKTQIITNVSHELRTPLVQVKAAVSLLAEDLIQNGPHEQSSVAEMATQAVARLESAVENIRQLAQTHNIRLSPVVVSDAIDLAIRHLQRSWTSRNSAQRVEKHVEDGLLPVLSDKRALGRLLQLLLDNALKFSSEDMPVYVAAYHLDAQRVWIGVQDFGIGISPEEHARIFEPFYQVDGSATRRYGGTGSGLALALLLASGMNTEIQLESVPNEGSTFSFVLPVADLEQIAD